MYTIGNNIKLLKRENFLSLVYKIMSSANSIVTWAQSLPQLNPVLYVKEPLAQGI